MSLYGYTPEDTRALRAIVRQARVKAPVSKIEAARRFNHWYEKSVEHYKQLGECLAAMSIVVDIFKEADPQNSSRYDALGKEVARCLDIIRLNSALDKSLRRIDNLVMDALRGN